MDGSYLEYMGYVEGFSIEFLKDGDRVVFEVLDEDSNQYETGIIEITLEDLIKDIETNELDYVRDLWKEAIEERVKYFICFCCEIHEEELKDIKKRLKYELVKKNKDWYLRLFFDNEKIGEIPVIERFTLVDDVNNTRIPGLRVTFHFENYDKFLKRLKEKYGEKCQIFEE
jgi:hypothetical protein